jgi:hypothetical protein
VQTVNSKRHFDLVVLARQPHTFRQYRPITALVTYFRRLMPYNLRNPDLMPAGGHYGVTRSLVAGLRQISANFAYEPDLTRTTAQVAIVLQSAQSLTAAMEWKKNGGCQFLLAGPNIVDHPSQEGGIIASPGIIPLIASEKMRKLFVDANPALEGRVVVWPAGVDADYWRPSGRGPRNGVLIYDKQMPDLAAQLDETLRLRGYRVETIHYSGKRANKYEFYEYRAALDRSHVCVFLTENEAQGLAATEAWSMDVPTFVHRVARLSRVDIVPYLTPATGHYWTRIEELLALLEGYSPEEYAARSWTLNNMTDAVCARQLLDLAQTLES